jgi:hypothetical protein
MARLKKGRVKQSRAHHVTVPLGDHRYVSIFCRGTVENPHDKVLIGSLSPEVMAGDLLWTVTESGYAETGAENLTRIKPRISQWLDGDHYIERDPYGNALRDGEHDPMVFYKESFRAAWQFKCDSCKFAFRIGDPTRIYERLNQLSTPGVIEIPLRAFYRVSQ